MSICIGIWCIYIDGHNGREVDAIDRLIDIFDLLLVSVYNFVISFYS